MLHAAQWCRCSTKWALLLGLMVGPAQASESDAPACYSAGDSSRYNHLFLKLEPGSRYKALVMGDIGIWGTTQGHWEAKKRGIYLTPEPDKDLMWKTRPTLLKRRGATLLVKKEAVGFWDWDPLAPAECTEGFAVPPTMRLINQGE